MQIGLCLKKKLKIGNFKNIHNVLLKYSRFNIIKYDN